MTYWRSGAWSWRLEERRERARAGWLLYFSSRPNHLYSLPPKPIPSNNTTLVFIDCLRRGQEANLAFGIPTYHLVRGMGRGGDTNSFALGVLTGLVPTDPRPQSPPDTSKPTWVPTSRQRVHYIQMQKSHAMFSSICGFRERESWLAYVEKKRQRAIFVVRWHH